MAPKQPGKEWLGWDDSKNELTNKKNRERLYTALTSTKDTRPEIKNPTDARQFQKCLGSITHKRMIEDGNILQELPPISQDSVSRLKQMKDFLYLIENLDLTKISDDEISALKTISSRILELVK